MLKKLILWTAAFSLAAQATRSLAAKGRIRQAKQQRADHREDLRTWEEEGGNLRPPAVPPTQANG
jgi:hypothetical protein